MGHSYPHDGPVFLTVYCRRTRSVESPRAAGHPPQHRKHFTGLASYTRTYLEEACIIGQHCSTGRREKVSVDGIVDDKLGLPLLPHLASATS